MNEYIYLMERRTKRERETRYFEKEVKIGISNKPIRRQSEVNEAIPGKIILLKSWPCSGAKKIEKSFHKQYSDCNFIPRNAGKGGGKTEWFRLSKRQLKALYSEIPQAIDGRQPNELLILHTMQWALVLFFILFVISNL